MDSKKGQLEWFEVPTTNEEQCFDFYSSVLGWKFAPAGPNYWMVQWENQSIGAIAKETDKLTPPAKSFRPYFSVASVGQAAKIISQKKATLEGDVVFIGPEMGYFQKFRDLDGNLMAVWSLQA